MQGVSSLVRRRLSYYQTRRTLSYIPLNTYAKNCRSQTIVQQEYRREDSVQYTIANLSTKKVQAKSHSFHTAAVEKGGHLCTISLASDSVQPGSAANTSRLPLLIEDTSGKSISEFPNIWLRDNCRCSDCVNQETLQKAFNIFAVPETISPREVWMEGEALHVTWDHDGHRSVYPWNWLYNYQSGQGRETSTDWPKGMRSWTQGTDIATNPPSVSYNEIMSDDAGVGKWTQKIREYGFCFVDGCPVSPEKTEELLERIAFIRTTHYGGFYDFTSDLSMKDTAYTSLALPAHTDTTYFSDPAGLQMFHLLSHTEGSGGHSLLVDGFEAARTLREEDPNAFKILGQVPIRWHASGNEGIAITPHRTFPVLDITQNDTTHHGVRRIRWNNDDRGVLDWTHGNDTSIGEAWYSAARKWNEILTRKDMEYWVKLEPGRPLIFDNWRVLHGRSSFTGKRRMCGGYINHDDYVSRWRNTNYSRKEVLSQVTG